MEEEEEKEGMERRYERMEFNCNDIPIMGVLAQVLHLSNYHTKQLFGKYDLKPWQAGILFVLAHNGEMSQRKLAKMLNLTPPSITTAIQKMEKLDYIRRKPDPGDQRVMLLSITEKGETYLNGIFEVKNQMEAMMFRGMSVEEKLLLKRLLIQVRENLLEGKDPTLFRPHL